MYPLARVAVLLSLLPIASGWAQIVNPGFDSPNTSFSPPTYSTTFSSVGSSAPSSAVSWSLYNNSPGPTTTSLLASTDPLGSGFMLQFSTGGGFNGLYQVFAPQSGGAFSLALDANVSSGQLYFASYSNSGLNVQSSVLSDSNLNGQWQTLMLPLNNPFSQIVIYSNSAGGASFSIDNLRLIPEPSTFALLALGGAIIGLRRGCRRHVRPPTTTASCES